MRNTLALFALFLAAGAYAQQQRCIPSETPRQCMQRLIAARAYVAAQAEVASAPTGPSVLSSPIRSAVKDFLSAASAHVEGSSVKDSGKALTLDYNLPGTILGARRQVNLEATLANPTVNPALTEEAASNPSQAPPAAKESLGRGDDVAVSVTFNPLTQRFGRDLAPHRALFDAVLLALVGTTNPGTAAVPAASFDTPFDQLVPDAAARVTALAEFETALVTAMPAAADRVTSDLARLAANQPQLYVSGLYHYRKEVVGPKETEVRVTWEIGTDNLNSFRRAEGRDCERRGDCLAALSAYEARTADAHDTGRLALAFGYRQTSANDPGLTAPAATGVAAHNLTYSATYGREVTAFIKGKPGRIDFTLNYDGKTRTRTVTQTGLFGPLFAARPTAVEATPQLLPPSTTRYAAAATVTQPLFQHFAVPISLVYAEHAQWLPGTSGPPLTISPVVPGNGHFMPFETVHRGMEVHVGLQVSMPSFTKQPERSPEKSCCCK